MISTCIKLIKSTDVVNYFIIIWNDMTSLSTKKVVVSKIMPSILVIKNDNIYDETNSANKDSNDYNLDWSSKYSTSISI